MPSRLCNLQHIVMHSTKVWQHSKLVYLLDKVNDYRFLELNYTTYVTKSNMSTAWPDYLYPYMILRSTKLLDDVVPNYRDSRLPGYVGPAQSLLDVQRDNGTNIFYRIPTHDPPPLHTPDAKTVPVPRTNKPLSLIHI